MALAEPTREGLELSKVQRAKIVAGDFYEIECAVRTDGSQPALEFLRALKAKRLEDDPDEPTLPADGQLHDYHKLLDACRQLAMHGEPKYTGQVNYLEDGVWEFKLASKRLTWYDTDARGDYTPKEKYTDRTQSPDPSLNFWWFPGFDRTIRLGHWFLKRSQRTPPADLGKSEIIRMEDLDHDRT